MQSHNNIILSIIIPCYNVKATIRQTVESVLRQTCSDFEIILVDDGSTDGSSVILDQLALQDERIKLVHKFNGGVSSARNIGLSIASGDYVLFLDGDDTIYPTLLFEIKKKIAESHYDMLLYGFDYERRKNRINRHIPYSTPHYIQEYLIGKLHVHISSLVVRKEYLSNNTISFNEQTFYSEDREFIISCFHKTKNIAIIPKVLFCYRWQIGSAMHIPIYTMKRSTSLDAMQRVYESLQGTGAENSALAALKTTIILQWRLFVTSKCEDLHLYHKLEQFSNTYLQKPSSLQPICKISVFSFIMGYLYRTPSLFKWILNI